jgi:hypothetical protein
VTDAYGSVYDEFLSEEKMLSLWDRLIGSRRPHDPLAYLAKVFGETPDLDTHLANCPPDEG